MLREAHHYSVLKPGILRLVKRLNPQPIRWGWGGRWAAELDFALENLAKDDVNLQAQYRCDLGDIYLPAGRFDNVIEQAEIVLGLVGVNPSLAARAVRMLFTSYRSTGQHNRADDLMQTVSARFNDDKPAAEVPEALAQSWLIYNQSMLELLREQGRIDEALALVDQMIWLDHYHGSSDPLLSADLFTHRSTLLWNKARYTDSVSDLQAAVQLYNQAGDLFTAESLQSNLGLVYWTMGELYLAEKSLKQAIHFYRETGSNQLITYDIGNLGLTYFARGQLEDALHLTKEHIDHAARINFVSEMNRGHRNLGTILYYLGRIEEAVSELKLGKTYFEKRGSRYGYQLDYLYLALCSRALGKPDEGRAEVSKVLDWAKQNNATVLLQLTQRCLALFVPPEEQEAILLESLELARQLNRSLEQAAVLLLLGKAASEPEQGRGYWETGVDLMRKMGANAWLEGCSLETPPFYPLFL